jgi:hypothetical protein
MGLNYFLGGVFVASLEGGFARYSYPRISEFQDSFEQTRIDARLFGEYRFSDIVGLNTTIMYDQAMGGDDIIVAETAGADGIVGTPDDGPPTEDNLEYSRFQAYIGMRVFW